MWEIVPTLGIFGLVLVSPGPDFSIVMKNALGMGRKEGFLTALGIGLGFLIHVSYCIFGLSYVAETPFLITWIRILGSLYLIYLGFKSFRIKSSTVTIGNNSNSTKKTWFFQGFFTNLLNPNVVIVFISIFSSLIHQVNPTKITAIGACVVLMAFSWFSIVSYVFSFEAMNRLFSRYMGVINHVFGLVLIVFGCQILLQFSY